MTLADVFSKAADYLDEHGWHQGSYFESSKENVPACLIGACMAADLENSLSENDIIFFSQEYSNINDIIVWNDMRERTKKEVTNKLRELADIARKEGR